ncbi:MAG: PAS domain S-box protein [Desulfobacteraceae bacterium]|nr:PAS domain S-box protein [Desulfobacteraceae bacterium]
MAEKLTYEELEQQVKELKIALGDIEQKKAINIFSPEERRFKEIIRKSSDSIVILNKDGLQTYVNDAVEKHLGFKPDELINISVIEKMIHPDDQQKTLTAFEEIIEHGQGGVQYRHKHKNGSWVYLEAWGTNQLNNPDIQGVVVNVRNITEWKKTEKALKIAETTNRNIFLNSQIGLFRTDINTGLLLDANDTVARFFGYKDRNELLAEPFKISERYIDSKDRERMISILMKDGKFKNFEARFKRNDGSVMWNRYSGKLISDNGWIEGVSEDITKEKQTEKALQESESYLQSVFGAVPVGICFMKDRMYQRVNPNWCDSFGYSEESLLGRSTEFLYENKEEYERVGEEIYEQILEHGIASTHTMLKRNDGEFRAVDLIAKPLNAQDISEGTVVVVHDITDLKKAVTEKIKAQKIIGEQKKLALVGQIAGKMAHDFNNVLAVIMGNAQLALLDSKEAKTKNTLEKIFNQTLRGKNLTKNLVAFAKDQDPKQEFFRLNEKIDLVIDLLKKDLEEIEIIKEGKPGLPDLLADPGMIEHGLVNLIQNSIHALSMIKQPKIIIRTYKMDGLLCLEIEDNGCGIPKEHIGNIYEPSFTLKGNKDVTESYRIDIKGTGYGMANVKKYIEMHKGNILVESKSGSGTKFTIKIPIVEKELTSEEKTVIQEDTLHFRKYILLVEDEQSLSEVQYKILTQEPCNHKVDMAINGQVAMDLFDRNTYDFVSLDYILPGNINGMDIYNYIRETNKNIPILFVSGNIEFLESIKELKQMDINIDHISKPCQNKDYVDGINKLLDQTLV